MYFGQFTTFTDDLFCTVLFLLSSPVKNNYLLLADAHEIEYYVPYRTISKYR
jgi:hypothetical protein